METLNIKKNIPNILTIFRIILVIPIITIFLLDNFSVLYTYKINCHIYNISMNQIIVAILFIIASFSDFLDGYLSRKYQWISNFGKFWDPLADKILINSVFILLAYKQYTFILFTIIFIIRDIIIDGLRLINAKNNIIISAKWSGKLKTILQMFAIIILLFLGTNDQTIIWWYWIILNLFIYLAIFMSIYSLFEYSIKYFLLKKYKTL